MKDFFENFFWGERGGVARQPVPFPTRFWLQQHQWPIRDILLRLNNDCAQQSKRVLPQYSLTCFLHQAQGGFLFLSADTGFPQWTFFCGVSHGERRVFWGVQWTELSPPSPSCTFFCKLFGLLSLACSFYPCLKVYFEIKCIFAHEIVMRKEDSNSNIERTFCDTAVLPGAWWQSSP